MRGELRSGLALLLLGAGACLTPVDPNRTTVAAVRVNVGRKADATVDTVQVRGTTHVHAAAIGTGGYDVGITDFTYRSSDTTIATVDATGNVRGNAPGVATITARAPQGQEGRATVVVVPSTIAYSIELTGNTGSIAFSTDYTRAYVVAGTGTLASLDALAFIQNATISLAHPAGSVAATSDAVYVTHPGVDSVSVISAAANAVTRTIFVGSGPGDIVASGSAAYVATRFDQRIVILKNGAATLGIPVGGEPHQLALSRDGSRLFATVLKGSTWRLYAIAPAFPDTTGSIALNGVPTAIASNGDGTRVYVLIGAASRVDVYNVGPFSLVGSVTVGSNPGGIAARQVGSPYVVVSGEPATVFDGTTLAVQDRIANVGFGPVAIRPDGLFAFVSFGTQGLVRVIAL